MINLFYDVVVIGGGPAGMSAALAAQKNGSKTIILERGSRLGGILNQCIHQGFGLHYFGEEMTGPEYANRFRLMVENSNIEVCLDSMVLNISDNKEVYFTSVKYGLAKIAASSIVLAMGCRERTAGSIMLPGTRPAGIYTAGMAQKLCNIDGYLVGKNVVILGSGDIGLIMARRMITEGANVKLVIELMPYSSGLKRNIVQCLDDYNIPIVYSHTITKIVGSPRIKGLYYAPVDLNKKPIYEKEQYIECDTLLLSVGLIPENDILNNTSIEMSKITNGAIVDQYRMTSIDGVFSCGNVLHVHDLVDNVSKESEIAGESASLYVKGKINSSTDRINVNVDNGIRYVVPQKILLGTGNIDLYFRTTDVFKNVELIVESNDCVVTKKHFSILTPGEMSSVKISIDSIKSDIKVRLK